MSNTGSTVEVKEDRKGDILVLRMKGRLDAISSPGAEKKFSSLLIVEIVKSS